jgi:NCS1 family nucleobase:cation symporter-1
MRTGHEPGEHSGLQAAYGTLPLLAKEREWGFGDFSWVNIGLAFATWAFLLGGTTALFAGAEHGIAAIVIGNAVGVAIMALSVCVSSGRYGIEQFTILRSVFGPLGVAILVALFLAVYGVGWASVLSIMFGRATTGVVNEVTGSRHDPNSLVVSGMAVLAVAISWLLLWRGPTAVKWLNRIVAPGKVLLCAVLLLLILDNTSWSEVTAAKPLAPFGDERLDFMIAVELNMAAGFGWWPVMGNLARMTRTPRAALWPNMIGVFAAAVVGEIVGLLAALSLGSFDPTDWMIPLAGAVAGALILAFIALANITAIVSIFYGMCLAMRQAGGRALTRVSWGVLTGALFLPVLVAVFFPATIYDNFFKFLAWTALVFAPLSGVCAVDYLLLRRQRIDERALYAHEAGSPYAYWHGVSPAALISVALGALTYFLLLNPQSLASHEPFRWISASLPACAVGALSQVVLTRVFSRYGDYGPASDVEPPGPALAPEDPSPELSAAGR